jgi:hypothetical protein
MHLVEKAAVRHSSLAHSFHPPSSPILGADSTLLAFLQIDELHTSSRRRRRCRRARASGHVHVNATFHFFFSTPSIEQRGFPPGAAAAASSSSYSLYSTYTRGAAPYVLFAYMDIYSLGRASARERAAEKENGAHTKILKIVACLTHTHPPTSPAHIHPHYVAAIFLIWLERNLVAKGAR